MPFPSTKSLALCITLSTPSVWAETLSVAAPVAHLTGVTVVVQGVDVTAFSRVERGRIVIDAPLRVTRDARFSVLDENGVVLSQGRARQGAVTDLSGAITLTNDHDTGPRYEALADLGIAANARGWSLSNATRVIGDDRRGGLDVYSNALTLRHESGETRMELAAGDVQMVLGHAILGDTLAGRGAKFVLTREQFEAGMALITPTRLEGYRDVDVQLEDDAFRFGASALWTRENDHRALRFGAFAYLWSNEARSLGDRGQALGLSFGLEDSDGVFAYSVDLAVSDTPQGVGWALAQRLDLSWPADALDIQLSVTHERATRHFAAPETEWAADLELFDVSGALSWETVDLAFSLTHARDNLAGDAHRLTTLSFSAEVELIWTLSGEGWRPDEIGAFAQYHRLSAGNGDAYLAATHETRDVLPDEVEVEAGLWGVWSHGWGETTIELSRIWFDDRGAGRELEDWTETALSLSHIYRADSWALTTGVEVLQTNETDPGWRAKVTDIDWSLGLEMFAPGAPRLAATYAWGRSDEAIRAIALSRRERRETMTLSADISPWLTDFGFAEGTKATLYAKSQRPHGSTWSDQEMSVGVQLSVSF